MILASLAQMPLTLASSDNEVKMVAIGIGGSIAIVAITCGAARRMYKNKQVESSRRELAAYVAEGSMTPDDAERLLNAGPNQEDKCG